MSEVEHMREGAVTFRMPTLEDGAAVYELIRKSPPLDLNSPYCYLLLCDHFRETCIMAERQSEVVGFISAYRHPRQEDTLFVWQVVVAEKMRGQRLAGAMLDRLLSEGAPWASFIETTVTPSNRSSLRFYRAFAEKHAASFQQHSYLTEDLFVDRTHEEEQRIRIGPLKTDLQ